ncbi:MAG: DUF1990 domain-containing protein [Acidimicrobiales bacterium]
MASVLAACERDAPSYEEVGATQDEVLPSGFHHVHAERRLGDPSLFERAVVGLESWKAHEGAGMSIFPARSRLTPDATVLTSIKIGPLTMVAPCRIIRRWESTTTFGFAYATLPGHPESGEESFSLERRNDGAFFVIRAFSRPASLLVRLGGPAGPAVQRLVTRKYVEGLQTFVS